jgi:phosphoglycolate phosphatase-like HAD superfamily hydrolase
MSSSRLVVFDIDGTLTDTNPVDDECFLRSVERMLGVDLGAVAWTDAPHVTDSAIADWLWTRHRKQRPTPADLEALREVFAASLREEIGRAPDRCRPLAGAAGLFDELRAAGWTITLATGGWRVSARMKLEFAGLLDDGMPMACADDALSRTDIIQLAVTRASEKHGRAFDRVVSVGDGPWDVAAARDLKLPFVGVAEGKGGARLRASGASTVLSDFSDRAAVLAALESATVPAALGAAEKPAHEEL